MRMYRKHDGLLMYDDFSTLSSKWQTSGNVSVKERPGYLRLSHAAESSTALFSLPQSDFAMEVTAEYTPSAPGDEAGILIWKNADESIEFLEYADPEKTTNVSEWKVRRSGNVYDLLAKVEGEWILMDTGEVAAHKIGVMIKGAPSPGFVPLDVDRVIVCASDVLTVGNLLPGYRVCLHDASGALLDEKAIPDGNTFIQFTMSNLCLSGRLSVYDNTGEKIGEIDGEFFGGDVYEYGTFLQIVREGAELSAIRPNDIGIMRNGSLLLPLSLHNPNTEPALNISLSISQYESKFGFQWADVAADESGKPGAWGDILSYPDLQPGQSVPFWVRVSQADNPPTFGPLFFEIDINHE
jgi:hypothetical protein